MICDDVVHLTDMVGTTNINERTVNMSPCVIEQKRLEQHHHCKSWVYRLVMKHKWDQLVVSSFCFPLQIELYDIHQFTRAPVPALFRITIYSLLNKYNNRFTPNNACVWVTWSNNITVAVSSNLFLRYCTCLYSAKQYTHDGSFQC